MGKLRLSFPSLSWCLGLQARFGGIVFLYFSDNWARGPILRKVGDLGAILGHLWAILGPSWGHIAAFLKHNFANNAQWYRVSMDMIGAHLGFEF